MTTSVDVFGGVRVVELAEWVFIPVAGALLADWGAEVIKIEHPQRGDGYRGLNLPAGQGAVNYPLEMANRNKRSVAIDLKAPGGRDLLLKLVGTADVFLTSLIPATLDRLGLGVEDLRAVNPQLIYARGHGYGVRGDEADRPAYDATAFWARGAVADTLSADGQPQPLPQRGAVGDRQGAVHTAFGIASALYRRERTGEPSVVDVSLLSTAMWMIGSDVAGALAGSYRSTPPLDAPRANLPNPLAASYRCADGRWLMICCLQADRYWADVCRVIDRPDLLTDERFTDIATRGRHSAELVAELDRSFAAHPLDEWRRRLSVERIPWGPFQQVTELIDDPQVIANGYVGHVETDAGSYRLPTGAVQFDEQPAALHPAPELGADSDELLLSVGLTWDELIELKVMGTVL